MPKQEMFEEHDLAALAKKYREASGKKRADAARDLGVAPPVIFNAEEKPERSLTKVRIRIIEAYAPLKVIGPRYWLVDK